MKILVDMDDVMIDLVSEWIKSANSKLGTEVTKEDVKDWDLSLVFGSNIDEVYKIVSEEDFWNNIKPIDGAVDALENLSKSNDVFIVTAAGSNTVKYRENKVLDTFFPFIKWGNVFVAKHKEMIIGDVIIDDYPPNLLGDIKIKILFDQPWNRGFDEKIYGARRVKTWEEVVEIITEANESFGLGNYIGVKG